MLERDSRKPQLADDASTIKVDFSHQIWIHLNRATQEREQEPRAHLPIWTPAFPPAGSSSAFLAPNPTRLPVGKAAKTRNSASDRPPAFWTAPFPARRVIFHICWSQAPWYSYFLTIST